MEGLAERGQKGLKLCANMPLVFSVCHGQWRHSWHVLRREPLGMLLSGSPVSC